MDLKRHLISEYAGHPLRVALNLFIVACLGVLGGHLLFGIELGPDLVIGAMLPALVAVVLAGVLKAGA